MPRKFDKSEWQFIRHAKRLAVGDQVTPSWAQQAVQEGFTDQENIWGEVVYIDSLDNKVLVRWPDGTSHLYEPSSLLTKEEDLFMMQQDADMERIKGQNEEYVQSNPDAPGRTTFPSNWTRRSGSNDVQVIPTDSENMFGEHSAEDGSGGVTSWPIFIYGDQSGVRIFIGRMDGYHAEMVPFLKSQGIDMDKYTMPPNPMPVRYTPETGEWREGQGSGHELRVPAEYTEKINEFLGLEPDEPIKFG